MNLTILCLVLCFALVSSARISLGVDFTDSDVVSFSEIEKSNHFEIQMEEEILKSCNPVECNKKCMENKVPGVCVNQNCFCMNKKDFIFRK